MKLFTDNMLNISLEDLQGQSYFKEVWSGILAGKRFRELIMQSIEIYEKHIPQINRESEKLLLFADVSDIDMINNKEIEWLEKEVNPIYEKLGFTHQAVIMPRSFFAQNMVKNYEGVSESGRFTTNMFSDELTALRWFFRK